MTAACEFDAIPRSITSGGSVRFFPRVSGFTKPLVAHDQTTPVIFSLYPSEQSDTYVKATTKLSTQYWPYFATDPSKSLIGSGSSNSWVSNGSTNSNQRFHIDLGSSQIINRIYYENHHILGSDTLAGSKTFVVQGSNDGSSFADLTYATDTGWTNITASQATFDQHVGADQADPKYITLTNTTAYRYYAIKITDIWGTAPTYTYMGLRRLELQLSTSYTVTVPAYLWAFGDTHNFTIDGSTTDLLLTDADDYFAVNDRVVLTTTSTLPTGLFSVCCYWIKTVSATGMTLSLTSGGSAVTYVASTGSGTHSIQHGSDKATPIRAFPTVVSPTLYPVTLTVNDASGTGTATITKTNFIRSDA